MNNLIFNILSYTGIVLGILISGYGLYSLVRRETFLVTKDLQTKKLSGKEALRYGLYYLIAGGIWVWFSISQLVGFFE